MRKVVLLTLLALALPTAAMASSYDFAVVGGTATVLPTSVSMSGTNTITGIALCTPLCGAPIATTGSSLSIILPSFSTAASTLFGAGGSLNLSATTATDTYLFSGTFTNGAWLVGGGGFSFSADATGTMTIDGKSFTTSLVIASGNINGCNSDGRCAFTSGDVTIGSPVPEPSTLGLLGTGLIGLAGAVRRKLRA